MIDLEATFEKYNDEFCKYDQPGRRDLTAFTLLNTLVPCKYKIVAGAEHDEIYLSTDCDKLAEVATEVDIKLLVRCGVRYDSDTGSLAMFV